MRIYGYRFIENPENFQTENETKKTTKNVIKNRPENRIKTAPVSGNMIEIRTDDGLIFLEGINEWIIRCVYTKENRVRMPSMLVSSASSTSEKSASEGCCREQLEASETEEEIRITGGKLLLQIDKKDGLFTWYLREDNRLLLREAGKSLVKTDVIRYTTGGEPPVIRREKTVDGERNFIQNLKPVIDRQAYQGKLLFQWQEQERIYGLGQGEEGVYNYRGHNQYLYQHNMRTPIPFLVSDGGYGVFVDCGSLMTFQDDHHGSYLYLDTVDQLDYYLIAGKDMDGIISGYRSITGRAAMLPKWAFGYIQSKEAYRNADEMTETARHYRRLQVPLDGLVQDWNTWKPGDWGQKTVDQSRYPDLRAMNEAIHRLHIHTMVSVWPNMNPGGADYRELKEAGFLLEDDSTYNAFDENARRMYWQQAEKELFAGGFDSWWCDSTEPFSGPDWGGPVKREPWERFRLVGEEHKKYLDPAQANEYALVHAQGIFENQRKADAARRVLNLTRSGYAGSQRYGTVLWSGDTCATWENFRIQIREGLNFALSGMPYWTLDIGGFFTVGSAWQNRGCGCNTNPDPLWFWQGDFNQGTADPGYRELYVRWLQYGTFLPMFRSHGTDTPREIWQFGQPGDPCYDAIERFINLRYRLMPYIYALAGQVWKDNGTIHRSLLFDYHVDEQAKDIWDQFMLGKELMVCPVTEAMYYEAGGKPVSHEKTRRCYLPSGASWYDFWTNEIYGGGQWIESSAELGRIPLFVRAGAVIPMCEGLQYAEEDNGKPTELCIYPGQDGRFDFYEDDNNSYDYENGAYSVIGLSWREETGTLLLEERQGRFAGMKEIRQFLVKIGGQERLIEYRGDKLEIKY